ncbi:MAG TPA: DegT/DnrJ/EryC1/StrS family aminotransferase [Alphaproteobacteria bacterium]|jgi:dTDP-4-amino-4,6-dideoxygalactose transaminase|nr:DegT/DnrJ/EryC1/StrS family aminotransferase [Alphaproteobacteria bacterium]
MIFNSLGSNYNFNFVFKSLFASNSEKNKLDLISFLSTKYDGKTVLLYKGREAIKLSLDILNLPKGTKVGITGFTCYAVYKSVVNANYSPIYLDIDKSTLNFSLEEIKKHKDLKVLIIQNTLGISCDIVKIKKHCLEKNIILIEDLAHSIGNENTGLYGDFVVLSFGQDKVIDAISGGALIIRNKKYQNLLNNFSLEKIAFSQQIKDRFYPLFTFLIRKTYKIGFGKLLHFFLKKLNILSTPVNNKTINYHELPSWYCSLVKFQFSKLQENLEHRRKIADLYQSKINCETVNSVLRFSLLINKRQELIKYLKQFGIFISDIWYDAPIAPKRFLKLTNYSGECPVSEDISDRIVNLPTHINVSKLDAEKISALVNQWQNTQQK